MDDRCILCKSSLNSTAVERSLEHIVPVSLGGQRWLQTRLVCRPCNSLLGHDVDSLADIPLVVALRKGAGLVPRRGVRYVYIDPDTGGLLHTTLVAGQESLDDERLYQSGRDINIIARTPARARE